MPIDYTEQIKLIALKIRTLRKARKLTVQELAYRCDIERSNLSRIETGRSNPTVKTLCIICNALDVPNKRRPPPRLHCVVPSLPLRPEGTNPKLILYFEGRKSLRSAGLYGLYK